MKSQSYHLVTINHDVLNQMTYPQAWLFAMWICLAVIVAFGASRVVDKPKQQISGYCLLGLSFVILIAAVWLFG